MEILLLGACPTANASTRPAGRRHVEDGNAPPITASRARNSEHIRAKHRHPQGGRPRHPLLPRGGCNALRGHRGVLQLAPNDLAIRHDR
eukprot:12197191-Alexandrium_andersonii.AAC.1